MLNKLALCLLHAVSVFADIAWRLALILSTTATGGIIVASLFYATVFADWRALLITLLALPLNIWSQMAFDNSFDDKVADAVVAFGDRHRHRYSLA